MRDFFSDTTDFVVYLHIIKTSVTQNINSSSEHSYKANIKS